MTLPAATWVPLVATISLLPLLSAQLQAQDPGPKEIEDRRKALDVATRNIQQPAAQDPVRDGPDGLPVRITDDFWQAGRNGTRFRLIDVTLDLMAAVGTSTERDDSLGSLQGGAHDPRKRGFTFQQAELGLKGAVDPYFTAEAYIIYAIDPEEGESIVELEEAFLTTTALPGGFQLEAGQFFTEFGRINPQHPHQWHFMDQPIVASRFFGGDGMRGPGARLGWLLPTDFFAELHFGVQNANGETMPSFAASDEVHEERGIGGRFFTEREVSSLKDLVYLSRLDTGFDLTDSSSMKLGVSALYGPNATGRRGYTAIYGADLVWKWRPPANERGWPFVIVEAEVMARRFRAAEQIDENDPSTTADDVLVPADTLKDWGMYAQVLYGFAPRFAAGLRVEAVGGKGLNYDDDSDSFVSRTEDAFRDNRVRISPMLAYHPSEFSRVRLQYNFDDARRLDGGEAHSVWLGAEVLFGRHPAHKY